ncbi:MAG: polyribonucleotide nucleotidyltransferase, partial [Chloroflexi bacterium]|nr:polyribonucleotide nucleotidyltransferase [Chloroflexota bacterium]
VTATASKEPREGTDFFPLTVDVEERRYAVGKIPGGFYKREGRPSTEAILLCRTIDRPLRPLFPKGYRNDVQIIVTPLSSDQEHDLDVISIVGASAALMISDIPFEVPVGAVRVGYVDGEFLINPTMSQLQRSILDLTLAGTAESVLMIEVGARECSEEILLEAIKRGHEAMQGAIALQHAMHAEVGKEKNPGERFELDPDVLAKVKALMEAPIRSLVEEGLTRADRSEQEEALREQMLAQLDPEVDVAAANEAFDLVFKEAMRRHILETGIRVDGRDLRTIRPLYAEVGLLPRVHGSALFSRGETQVLNTVTLGSSSDEQEIEGFT